ncbi:hypothetical protein TUBRATIS_23950 [Tubulinosema ratisbonensis]|uniref:Uncharacterized protein n=1 Tax=Tubulinosema ratisbonensis TaxID=291195 RepID=A0A437AJB0_9MICR|nr:hypothetical protein TUBRATIS_23950 [Tubulinosema ratisbonensis]
MLLHNTINIYLFFDFIKLTQSTNEPTNYVINYIKNYQEEKLNFLKKAQDIQSNNFVPFIFLLKKRENSKYFQEILEIHENYLNFLTKEIDNFFCIGSNENSLALFSRCFFIVLNELIMKFSIQFILLLNQMTNKRKKIEYFLNNLFYLGKKSSNFKKKNILLSQIVNIFYDDFLEENLESNLFDCFKEKDKNSHFDPILSFNIYFIKLKKKFEKAYIFERKDYFKSEKNLSDLKNINLKNIILYYIRSIFKSKEFKFIKKFIPEVQLYKDLIHKSHNPLKRLTFIHGTLNHLILQFNLIYFLLFGKESDLFLQRYIPIYKIIIFKRLKFKLRFISYYFFNQFTGNKNKTIEEFFKLMCYSSFNDLINAKTSIFIMNGLNLEKDFIEFNTIVEMNQTILDKINIECSERKN